MSGGAAQATQWSQWLATVCTGGVTHEGLEGQAGLLLNTISQSPVKGPDWCPVRGVVAMFSFIRAASCRLNATHDAMDMRERSSGCVGALVSEPCRGVALLPRR